MKPLYLVLACTPSTFTIEEVYFVEASSAEAAHKAGTNKYPHHELWVHMVSEVIIRPDWAKPQFNGQVVAIGRGI